MKIVLILAAILALASCQVYPLNVSNDCSSLLCNRDTWYFNNTSYDLRCPKAGNNSRFRVVGNQYVFDIVAYNRFGPDQTVTLPLTFNALAQQDGAQYYTPLDNSTYFAILNCTIPVASNYTTLCRSHGLVGGKFLNGTFQQGCAFGLDVPRSNGFLTAQPIDYTFE